MYFNELFFFFKTIIKIVGLEYLLTTKLYGQEIAHEIIIHALRGHLGPYGSSKALAMSFHGTPGTGKNYVVQMIASTFYKYGAQSQYFHFFNGRNDFPLRQKTDEYKVCSNSDLCIINSVILKLYSKKL